MRTVNGATGLRHGTALRNCVVMLGLVFAAGCTDSTGPNEGRQGRYVLSTVNRAVPPALLLEHATGRIEILGGNLRLNGDMTYTDSTRVRTTIMFQGQPLPGAEVKTRTDVSYGSYRINGDTVHFSSLRGERYVMTFQVAGPLVQNLAGAELIYRKR